MDFAAAEYLSGKARELENDAITPSPLLTGPVAGSTDRALAQESVNDWLAPVKEVRLTIACRTAPRGGNSQNDRLLAVL